MHDISAHAPVVCVVFELALDAHRRKLRGVMDYARRTGWDVEVAGGYLTPELLSPADYNAYDGLILDRQPPLLTGSWKEVYRPFVVIDGGPDDRASQRRADIRCDADAIGRLAAETLQALSPSSYAFVPAFPSDAWSSLRGDAFLAALRDPGVPAEAYAPVCQDRTPEHLDAECSRLAAWLAERPRPVAVFAANDAVATFVYAACRRAHLAIPDDVQVLGVDNDETVCEWSRPTLSSILVDFESCGRQAAALLDGLIQRRRGAAHRLLTFGPLSVVNRASTRPRLPHSDTRLARALDIIERDACRGLTVSELARSLGLSRRSLELLFRSLGETPAHRLSEAKLRRVRDLLLSTSHTISRIASECGFPSVVYLAGLFKRRHGITMSVFRQRRGNGTAINPPRRAP